MKHKKPAFKNRAPMLLFACALIVALTANYSVASSGAAPSQLTNIAAVSSSSKSSSATSKADTDSSSSSSASTSTANSDGGPGTACTVDPNHPKLQDQDTRDKLKPWRRNGKKQVTVYFSANKVTAQYKNYMNYAAKVWSKSACIEIKIVDKCPVKSNCIPVTLKKSGGDGDTDGTFTDKIQGKYLTGGSLVFYTKLMASYKNDRSRKSVVVHEMGHGIGLSHRKSKKALMNGFSAPNSITPDKVDYQNLRVLYGKQK